MSFVLAGLVFIASVALAFFIAFAQGMVTAPQYDNTPVYVMVAGTILAFGIAASHWVGW